MVFASATRGFAIPRGNTPAGDRTVTSRQDPNRAMTLLFLSKPCMSAIPAPLPLMRRAGTMPP